MDYGKLAYLKAEDLAKRLSANEAIKTDVETLTFTFSRKINCIVGDKQSYYFYLGGTTTLELSAQGMIMSEVDGEAEVVLTLNDVAVATQKINLSRTPSMFKIFKKLKQYSSKNNSVALTYSYANTIVQQICCIEVRGKTLSLAKQQRDINVAKYGLQDRYFLSYGSNLILYIDPIGVPLNYELPFEADSLVPFYPWMYYSAAQPTASTLFLALIKDGILYFYDYLHKNLFNLKNSVSKVSVSTLPQGDSSAFVTCICMGKLYTSFVKINNYLAIATPFTTLSLGGNDRAVEVKQYCHNNTIFMAVETKSGVVVATSPANAIKFTVHHTLNIKNLLSVDMADNVARIFYRENGCVKVMSAASPSGVFVSKSLRYCDKIISIASMNDKYFVLDDAEVLLIKS